MSENTGDTNASHEKQRSVSLVSSGSSTLDLNLREMKQQTSESDILKLDDNNNLENSTPSRSLSKQNLILEDSSSNSGVIPKFCVDYGTLDLSDSLPAPIVIGNVNDDSDNSDEFVDAPEVDEPEHSIQHIPDAFPGSPGSRSIQQTASPSHSLQHRNSESQSLHESLGSVQSLYVGGPDFLGLTQEKMKQTLDNENMEDGDKAALHGMIDDFKLGRRHHSDSGKLESTKPSGSDPDQILIRDIGTGAVCTADNMEELTTMQEIDAIRTRDQAYRPTRIKIRRPGGLDGFEGLFEVQRFNAHGGILRVASFNKRGNLLATAGADMALKLWTVCGCSLDRNRWKVEKNKDKKKEHDNRNLENQPAPGIIINEIPYKQYYGHKKDILDLSWSDHDFIITASMDKTVILWHHSKEGPLRVFQHGDGVTGVCFRQTQNASLFLSCTINSRASLWDARRKRVLSFVEADSNVCTAIAVSPNGRFAVVGLDNGQLLFYEINDATHDMTYYTTKECYTALKKAKKVTGIVYDQIDPSYEHGARCVIVTTNDDKVRVFDTRNYEMVAKYLGTHNSKGYQIRAHVHDGYLICGSDQSSARIWKTNHRDGKKKKTSTLFKKRDYFREEKHISWDPHPGKTVTTTHFAPPRTCVYVQRWHSESLEEERRVDNVLITADESGQLKVYINVTREDAMF